MTSVVTILATGGAIDAQAAPKKIKIKSTVIAVGSDRVARIKLKCPKAAKKCKGTLVLQSQRDGSRPGNRTGERPDAGTRDGQRPAPKKFTIKGGRKKTVKLALFSRAYDQLLAQSLLTMTATVEVKNKAGKKINATKTITLLA